ncbi:MAG TPA: hypothetical protein VE573_16555 [Nitrososphaeraceae archaeon]|nr:hypothetical protein [Nitrososphaeraceae archaeon]
MVFKLYDPPIVCCDIIFPFYNRKCGEERRQKQLEQAGSEQTPEFAPFDERSNVLRDSNLAESGFVGPVEDVSEDFDKMNRGQDVITESERAKRLEQRLNEAERNA